MQSGLGFIEQPIKSAVNWDLIQKIDPMLLDFDSTNHNLLKFLGEIPYYNFTSTDRGILRHPLALRLVQILQKSISEISQNLNELKEKYHHEKLKVKKLKEKVSQTRLQQPKEKCYVCSKSFSNLSSLNHHIKKTHPKLVTSWNKIISSDYSDENDEAIAKLKAEIYELRVQLHDQDANRQPTPVYIVERPVTRIPQTQKIKSTYVAIQPPHGPRTVLAEDDRRRYLSKKRDDLSETIHSAQHSVKQQADVVNKKRRRAFRSIREALRIELETQIPIPHDVNASGSIIES